MTSKDKPKGHGKPKARNSKSSSGDRKAGATKPATSGTTADAVGADEPQRISKLLARAGVASRRDVERMIMEGRVKLNGVLLDTPVVNATLADSIEVDGHPVRGIERTRLWLYHKPAGLVTTNADPEGRPTVFDNLPEDLPRVLSVGRLDINTEGLLLLTNDGGLARVLELPATGWLRRYRVRAHGEIDQAALDRLKEGIAVDGVLYGAIDATLDRVQGSNVWITMGLREGKNREIKNVLGALGLDVNRLIRISYGPFQLGDLPEGEVQEIRGRTLREQLGPRLIEEAKANFDAPLYNDQAPAREVEERDEKEAGDKPERGARQKEDKRERALARLDTRRADGRSRERGERGAGRSEERQARPTQRRSRASNVWMAPGARPVAAKKPKATEDDSAAEPARGKDAEAKRSGRAKPGGSAKAAGARDAAAKGRPDKTVRRKDEATAGGFERRRPAEGAERNSRDHGDRPPRRDGSERPRSERAPRPQRRSDQDRPSGDRARAKPPGAKPTGGKSASAKPGGAKSSAPRSSGPRGGKPGGGKSGGKPGGHTGGGKPRGKGKS